MSDADRSAQLYTTAAMAEILLSQDMLRDAARVIEQLDRDLPGDEKVRSLKQRLSDRLGGGDPVQTPADARGADRVELLTERTHLFIAWELTDDALGVARRQVRYSGQTVLRLFTAQAGRRGVRTTTRDFDLEYHCGNCTLSGMPTPAVFTAAVGFLGRNGAFVPMARALPVTAEG